MNPNNKLNLIGTFNHGQNLNEHNFQESFFPEITYFIIYYISFKINHF